jgi:hypothetical protein
VRRGLGTRYDAFYDFPGPQRPVRGYWRRPPGLLALLVIVALLTAREVVKANLSQDAQRFWLWHLSLLGVPTAISLFVGILTLLVVRSQFALANRPEINYECMPRPTSQHGLPAMDDSRLWAAILQNSGGGLARITSLEYEILTTHPTAASAPSKYQPYADAIEVMKRCGLTLGTDYWLTSLSSGSAIASDAVKELCELTAAAEQHLLVLDARLIVKSLLGETFVKEIYCIPRRNLTIPHSARAQGHDT